MSDQDLKSRFPELESHINSLKGRLRLKGLVSADHQATAAELKTPHRLLSEQLHDEIEESETPGRHVRRPEASVRQWADRLDFDID